MTKVILVSGKKRAGKDYVSELIMVKMESLGYTIEQTAFADTPKQMLATTFGITVQELNDLKNCNYIIETTFKDMDEFSNYDEPVPRKEINFRELLQNFATDASHEVFGKDVWFNITKQFIADSKCDFVIISDFRFDHEYIEGATTINVYSEFAYSIDPHSSENGLVDFDHNHYVNNTGFPDLTDNIVDLCEYITQ